MTSTLRVNVVFLSTQWFYIWGKANLPLFTASSSSPQIRGQNTFLRSSCKWLRNLLVHLYLHLAEVKQAEQLNSNAAEARLARRTSMSCFLCQWQKLFVISELTSSIFNPVRHSGFPQPGKKSGKNLTFLKVKERKSQGILFLVKEIWEFNRKLGNFALGCNFALRERACTGV